jgi:hypothetical protein
MRPFVEISAFLQAGVLLIAARVTLAAGGFARMRRMLTRERESAARAEDASRARMLSVAMRRAAHRLPIRTTCLDRALALWWLLALHGIGGTVRIGVRGADPFEAHAWVEHGGEALYDDEASSYTPFEALQ